MVCFRRHAERASSPQIRDIGSGNFGVAKLMRDKQTGELVAVKFIERGEKVGDSPDWLSTSPRECTDSTLK